MLDDLKFIHQKDPQDALGIAEKEPDQLAHEFDQIEIGGQIENIVFAGMGGSALAALLGFSWPGYKLPLEVCRQYHIPKYVSEKTLFIASSYSGNTEETLAALAEAENAKAKIVIIAGGGKLTEIAQEKNYPYYALPKVGQPRYAVFYCYKALVTILVSIGAASQEELDALATAASYLKESSQNWLPTVPANNNQAKKLAMSLVGKSIVIYAGPMLAPAAYKWKISFNENAKNIAWWSQNSEFDHNELSGWIAQPREKPYAVIDLRSNLEHPQIQKRFKVADRLLSGLRPMPEIVEAKGNSVLEQLLWTVFLGDFTSLYLALVNNVDPSPVDLQEKFKKELT